MKPNILSFSLPFNISEHWIFRHFYLHILNGNYMMMMLLLLISILRYANMKEKKLKSCIHLNF